MDRTLTDRLHAVGPLILRLGLAAVLAHHGLGLADDLFNGDGVATAILPDTAAATVDGVRLSAGWSTLLGLGEMLTAGLLVIGLLTRLVVMPMIGMAAFGVARGFPVEGLPTNEAAMLLVAAAGLSLLISGAGALALTRRRPRVVLYEVPVVEDPPPAPRRREARYAAPRKPLGQRISNFMGKLKPKPSFTKPKRRWRSWPQRDKRVAW